MAQELQYPPTPEQLFPYSVKVEQMAKGARVSVHCYNNHIDLVAREAIETYLKVRRQLIELGCKVAPEE
jgi:hypothetical protein